MLGFHAGAGLLVAAVPIGLAFQAALLGMVVASLYRQLRSATRTTLAELVPDKHGGWRFHSGGIRYRIAAAARDPFAVRLLLEDENGRRHARLVMRDALDARTYHAVCSLIAQRRLPLPDTGTRPR